ncbi:hypothetical protein [Rhodovulum imhoffii]|nr:hypothetical protein [Rhodovulum imhoffii]MBK5932737.1 hypothetical protein [Rhodovulum imhoffii]
MNPIQRREALKRRLGPGVVRNVRALKARQLRMRMASAERLAGIEASHKVLWKGPAKKQGWAAVKARIEQLAETLPEQMENFVETGLRMDDNPLILINMAQHPLSASAMARILAKERTALWPEIDTRMKTRGDYAAAFLVATAMTADNAALDQARARIPDIIGDPFSQIIDSYGQRPADRSRHVEPVLRGLKRNGLRQPKRHRLVIANTLSDPAAFLPLLRGAECVTLIGLKDTFGKAEFAPYRDYPGVGEIMVEHIRTRITRFCQNYIDINVQVRNAAQDIAQMISRIPDLVPEGDMSSIELAIADHLFFRMLRLRATEELLKDPDFDHIVVAFTGVSAASEFVMTLAGVKGLTSDPRVEFMSLDHSISKRLDFHNFLTTILNGPRIRQQAMAWLPKELDIPDQLRRNAAVMASPLPDRAVGRVPKLPSVLVATTANPAYISATAGYAAALQEEFPTGIVVSGGGGEHIHKEIENTGAPANELPFHLLRTQYILEKTAFKRWMSGQLAQYCLRRRLNDTIAHLIASGLEYISKNLIQSQILYGLVLDEWFDRMARERGLPDVIVLTTCRSPSTLQIASTARRYKVPTLSVEAHALNANYSRYAKVSSDYYGVISEQFRTDAENGFGISRDRTRVIGTPRIIMRQIRPAADARAELAADGEVFPLRSGVISFFSQPSEWGHVSNVWRMILLSAQELGATVLLKPHPEETETRREQYMSIARQIGAEKNVHMFTSSPDLLIEASDVVLTGYSTAAVDAAIAGRPVICVTYGDVDYPLAQHELIHAPLVRSQTELCEEIRKRLSDPAANEEAQAAFLAAEPQFVEGPAERLCQFVRDIAREPSLRGPLEVPSHLFLDPPYPTFSV